MPGLFGWPGLAPEGTAGNAPARVGYQSCQGGECPHVTSRRWLETLSSLETLNQLCRHQVQSVTKLHILNGSLSWPHTVRPEGGSCGRHLSVEGFNWEVRLCFALSEGGS